MCSYGHEILLLFILFLINQFEFEGYALKNRHHIAIYREHWYRFAYATRYLDLLIFLVMKRDSLPRLSFNWKFIFRILYISEYADYDGWGEGGLPSNQTCLLVVTWTSPWSSLGNIFISGWSLPSFLRLRDNDCLKVIQLVSMPNICLELRFPATSSFCLNQIISHVNKYTQF